MRKLVVLFLMAVLFTASCTNEDKRPEYELYTELIERAQDIQGTDIHYQLRPLRRQAKLEALGWGLTLEAQVLPEVDMGFFGDTYIIEVNRLPDYRIIEVLSHEVIHLQQYATGELQYDKAKSKQVIYEGVTYKDITKIPYNLRRWERDAFVEGKILASKIRKQLRDEAIK